MHSKSATANGINKDQAGQTEKMPCHGGADSHGSNAMPCDCCPDSDCDLSSCIALAMIPMSLKVTAPIAPSTEATLLQSPRPQALLLATALRPPIA